MKHNPSTTVVASRLARPLVVTTALALGAISPVILPATAQASLSGGNGGLTASNGSAAIQIHGLATLTTTDKINQIAWSPDGSRAVYLSADNHIRTVRFDNGSDIVPVTTPSADPQPLRSSPTWLGSGTAVLFAQKDSAGARWRFKLSSPAFGTPQPINQSNDDLHYLNPDAGPGRDIVFQKQVDNFGNPDGQPAIYRAQVSQVGLISETAITADAANPAMSPDGSEVAFVRAGQIWACAVTSCGTPRQVTSDAGAKDDPTWSPDGKVIAFRYTGDDAVATAAADGSQKASPVKPGLKGIPAYQPIKRNLVARLFGPDRFQTAIEISKSTFGAAGQGAAAKSVVLSRSDLFADALGGAALASVKEGPLLLTPPTSLHPGTQAEIKRLLGNNNAATVYLLGGTGAISTTVEKAVIDMGYQVKRLSGADRFATSVAIADEVTPKPSRVLVATGKNFPDALAAGAAAGGMNFVGAQAVVILSNDGTLTPSTSDYLGAKAGGATVYGIGGQGSTAATDLLGDKVVKVSGANRYETARLVARTFFPFTTTAGIATGSNWPDALAGGASMGRHGGPLLLTPSNTDNLVEPTRSQLSAISGSVNNVVIFGGPGTLNTAIEGKAGAAASGPAGFDAMMNPNFLEL